MRYRQAEITVKTNPSYRSKKTGRVSKSGVDVYVRNPHSLPGMGTYIGKYSNRDLAIEAAKQHVREGTEYLELVNGFFSKKLRA